MVKTSETPLGKLGSIWDDNKIVNYNVLYSVALSLIRQFAVMCVDAPNDNVTHIPL